MPHRSSQILEMNWESSERSIFDRAIRVQTGVSADKRIWQTIKNVLATGPPDCGGVATQLHVLHRLRYHFAKR